jgi:hypothetical protein
MKSHILHRISKLGPILGDLAASATGCFVFTRGFRLVAMDERGSDTGSPMRVVGTSPKLLAGIGAAIFLIAFVTSEALATVVALRH